MKNTILLKILIFLSIFNNNIFSQNLSGKFFDETDFLFFNDKNISFSVQSNGGLITVLKGNGEYQIIDDFLIIKTKESKFEKSKINPRYRTIASCGLYKKTLYLYL